MLALIIIQKWVENIVFWFIREFPYISAKLARENACFFAENAFFNSVKKSGHLYPGLTHNIENHIFTTYPPPLSP